MFVKCIILCTFVCYWYEYDTAPSCTSVLQPRVLLGYSRQKCHPSTAAGLGWVLQCCSHCSEHHVLGVMGVSPQQGRCASAWVGYQHLYLWRCIQNRCRTKQLFPPLHWEVWCTALDTEVVGQGAVRMNIYWMLWSDEEYVLFGVWITVPISNVKFSFD